MKKTFFCICIICLTSLVYSQTLNPIKITFKKSAYKCSNGDLTIVGYDSTRVYLQSDCSGKTTYLSFEIKTGKITEDSKAPTNLKTNQLEWPKYVRDTTGTAKELLYRLYISKFTDKTNEDDKWYVYSYSWNLISNERLLITYAAKDVDYHGLFDFGTHGILSPYSIHKNAVLGIEITKYDHQGKIAWDKVFHRGLLASSGEIGDFSAPLLIQHGNYLYVFYVDEDQQFYEQSLNNLTRFENIHKKYDIICQQINNSDGSNKKYLISSKIATQGIPILNGLLKFNDQTFILISGTHKRNGSQITKISLKQEKPE